MAAARVLFYTGPARYWLKFVQPLLRLLNASKEVERVVLVDLVTICRTAPVSLTRFFLSFCLYFLEGILKNLFVLFKQDLFAPYYTRFLIRSDDLTPVKKDKIRLLLSVLTVDNYAAILRELIVSRSHCAKFVEDGFERRVVGLDRTVRTIRTTRLLRRQSMVLDGVQGGYRRLFLSV